MLIKTIDFEGSSYHGCPIEVGVAMWEPGSRLIRTYSSLIRPIPEWLDDPSLWDPEAERVHGISRTVLLSQGRPVRDVVQRLEDLLAGSAVYCDGGEIDAGLRARLYQAAGSEPGWRLGTMAEMVRNAVDDPLSARAILKRIFHGAPLEHRAGPDARRLLEELADGKGPMMFEPIEA